jgi:hypothetical protein
MEHYQVYWSNRHGETLLNQRQTTSCMQWHFRAGELSKQQANNGWKKAINFMLSLFLCRPSWSACLGIFSHRDIFYMCHCFYSFIPTCELVASSSHQRQRASGTQTAVAAVASFSNAPLCTCFQSQFSFHMKKSCTGVVSALWLCWEVRVCAWGRGAPASGNITLCFFASPCM